jgi:hypothetical protein
VPFTSFSENEALPDGRKPPIWFALESRPLACFAGIWTNWKAGLFDDQTEIVFRPLQFFDLVELLLPHIATASRTNPKAETKGDSPLVGSLVELAIHLWDPKEWRVPGARDQRVGLCFRSSAGWIRPSQLAIL